MQTTIQKIDIKKGQRVLVLSDIHGHVDYLVQLLRKVGYGGDDVLVIVGDLVDKGPDSLQTVQLIMELAAQNQVYVSAGNVDIARCNLLCDTTEGSAQRFLDFVLWQKKQWGCGFLLNMFTMLGINIDHLTPENAQEYQELLREHFKEEIDFLLSRPTILDMGRTIFVHGGIPTDDLESLRGTECFQWLKNGRFLEKDNHFSRCVVVGHWPVSLYVHDREWLKPIFDFEKNIISMDGGCGVQEAGQLNVLIFPDKDADMREIAWDFYDGCPSVIAKQEQAEEPFSLYLQYFDSQVEQLEEKEELVLCRHLNSGKQLWIPKRFFYTETDGTLHVDNFSDAKLAVRPGDEISAVYQGSYGCYGKIDGILGWYQGDYENVPEELQLIAGRPMQEKLCRPREKAVYDLLDSLGISYSHIAHGEAKTMQMCEKIDEALGTLMCKNLFLRNQQKTKFYLLMMPGSKKFKTKELSKQINSARLSFAEGEYMEEFLHIAPGAVSVMGLMNDKENRVQLLIDRDVLAGECVGCHPCVNTSSLKIRMDDLTEVFLPAVGHEPIVVELTGE